MRCKAIFDKEQKPVSFYQHGENMTVCIALNPVEVKTETEFGETVTQYEYDYNEINAPDTVLNCVDILANPEKYLDYELPVEQTTEQKQIADLEEQNEMLTSCLLEMSAIIYA